MHHHYPNKIWAWEIFRSRPWSNNTQAFSRPREPFTGSSVIVGLGDNFHVRQVDQMFLVSLFVSHVCPPVGLLVCSNWAMAYVLCSMCPGLCYFHYFFIATRGFECFLLPKNVPVAISLCFTTINVPVFVLLLMLPFLFLCDKRFRLPTCRARAFP